MNRYDFLIVGGGPVGCRAAYKLAIAGHQVAVLEKNSSIGGPVCCTGIVSRDCLKRFSIPQELVLKELSSAVVHSPSGKIIRLERKDVQAAVIDRGAFNAWMARQAQDAGADYLLAHNVTDIQVNPDGVVATVDRRGKKDYFTARAMVLACGFGTHLPEKLGSGKAREWTAGAQTEVQARDLKEVEIYLGKDIAPGFFGWLVPCGESTALAGLMAKEDADGRLDRFLSLLKDEKKIAFVKGKPLYRGITLMPPRATYKHNVLLAGDAAGQVKPLTGGGGYFGLLCADMAAEALHASMEAGDFSVPRLSAYEKEWKRLLERELRLGGWAHRLYGKMSDARIESLLAMAERRGLIASLENSPQIGFDWHGSAMLQVLRKIMRPFSNGLHAGRQDNKSIGSET
jgi:digeranylgeranylglycerophospholipid reductase